jgi:heme O synthase-like polyprenyltransferase
LALFFSVLVALLPLITVFANLTPWWFAIPGILLGLGMTFLALRFVKTRERSDARKLFLYTLLYLPVFLGIALIAWTR